MAWFGTEVTPHLLYWIMIATRGTQNRPFEATESALCHGVVEKFSKLRWGEIYAHQARAIKTLQGQVMAKREDSSFKHSDTSQGQRSSGDSGRSLGSYVPGTDPSSEEVHLAIELLKTPIIRKLVRQVREQLKREGVTSFHSPHSDPDPELGAAIPNNATPHITSTGSRVSSWVKKRLLSLRGRIKNKLEADKYKDRSYDPDLHLQGYNSATNTVVVVAALIATLSFAALLQPPGGLSDGARTGTANLAGKPAFKVFFISNGMALFVALLTILILTSVVPRSQYEARVLYEQGKVLVWIATIFTVVAFSSAAYIVSGVGNRVLAWIVFCAAGATILLLFTVVAVVSVERKLKKIRSKKRKLQRSQPIAGYRLPDTHYNRCQCFNSAEKNHAIPCGNRPPDQ